MRKRRVRVRATAPCVRGGLEADSRYGCGRTGEGHGDNQARGDGPCPRHDDTGKERADERPEPLAGARCDVRSDELPGSLCERRKQRRLDRPDERADTRDRGGEHVHELDRQVGADGRRGQHRADTAHNVDPGENAIAAVTLDERGRKRCRQNRGDRPDRPENADRERSTGVVHEDEEHDQECPIGCRTRRPRELEPPDGRVPQNIPKRCSCRRGEDAHGQRF